MKLKLSSSVELIKGVGKTYLQLLKKYGIFTVGDLLLHFPMLYIDFNQADCLIEPDQKKLYKIDILDSKTSTYFKFRRKRSLVKVNTKIGEEQVLLVFFNKPYLGEFFKTHQTAYIFGTIEKKNNCFNSNNPLVFTESDNIPVIPVYSAISTLRSGQIKNLITAALDVLEDNTENLPQTLLKKYSFPSVTESLKKIHFPESNTCSEIDQVKKRFIYSEFLFFQLELQYIRDFFKRVHRVHHYDIIPDISTLVKQRMGFGLTEDQEKACNDIIGDFKSDYAMQRLLQGDVGSGKTIVAFITLLIGAMNGKQGAFLAPTEILAGQHYSNAKRFFKDKKIELLTGSTPSKKRKEILKGLAEGEIDIIFGTHALITEGVHFKKLAIIVIDEQHRFGVSQRAALYYKGNAVDLLVTTATPIPRTMLLSLYNDLSVSIIKTKPQGRLPIITKILSPAQRDEFYCKLKGQLEKGDKAYIILPLIEKSDFFAELKDIETESLYYKEILNGIPLGIVTGRTSGAEKDEMLQKLADGEIRVLIATTVIEVGIDVKDATAIVIENADRYGLSQLHQLRGRVGRGSVQSYCYLFPSQNLTENGKKRLTTIKETEDGFKIAETDLEMRGGGIISGLEQSGFLDFKIGNLSDHLSIFKEAQKDSIELLRKPELQNEFIRHLLDKINTRLKNINFS